MGETETREACVWCSQPLDVPQGDLCQGCIYEAEFERALDLAYADDVDGVGGDSR